MSGIKRLEFDEDYGMVWSEYGEYVSLADYDAEVACLRDEADSLRKDAERYRWLRSQHESYGASYYVCDHHSQVARRDLDAALTPQWEPISTAPKDGEWIILGLSENWKLGVDGRSCPGYWLEGWEHGADYEGRESGWVDAYHNDVEPNCWLPLPAHPEGE